MQNLYRKYSLFMGMAISMMVIVSCNGKTQKDKMDQSNESMHAQADTMQSSTEKLNMNTASAGQFRTISNVGDRMVHEFEEYRPYTSILQFRKEIGKYVDDDQVAAYEKHIYVPIQSNKSDEETLRQIPGLTKEEAQKLIDGRPYASTQAFVQALSSFCSNQQIETAKSYIKAGS